MANKAIVLMAIGEKYIKMYSALRDQFDRYALTCGADLRVCTHVPDPKFHRSLLAQKLLLPKIYSAYDLIAFIDLDVFINNFSPSIFDELPALKGFAAAVTPRGEHKFNNMVDRFYRLPEIKKETHQSYFEERGYPLAGSLRDNLFSINGGVWVARPSMTSELFESAYYSDFRESWPSESSFRRSPNTHEEGLMAYYAQTNGIFKALEPSFNRIVIHEVFRDPDSGVAKFVSGNRFRFIKRINRYSDLGHRIFPRFYSSFVMHELSQSNILHFGGGLPFMGLKSHVSTK